MHAASGSFLLLAVLAGCAGEPERSGSRLVQIPLNATAINAGQTGRANLVAMDDRTEVALWISGVPPLLASRPVHLYAYLFPGTCANPGAEPAYALTEKVLASSPYSTAIAPAGGPLTLTNIAPVPLEALERGRYAVRVFTAPADGYREIFCGDLG